MNQWKELWKNRVNHTDEPLAQETLLKLNGYDGKQSDLNPNNLGKAQQHFERVMDLQRGESIYEIACGAGAFMWRWRSQQFHTIGGCDISANLIGYATEALPQGHWSVADATSFPVDRWDHVVSFGLCMYLPKDEMYTMLNRMIMKAKRSISLYDIPDLAKKQGCEDERRKLIPDYDERYKELNHFYHSKEELAAYLESLGLDYEIYDQDIPGYENAKWRFNVTVRL